ncbi:hypothetical protein GCM10010520_36550 [Rhizobium viscosum]
MLNHPAVDREIERGRADCARPIGDPGSTTVWESWRNAGKIGVQGEVFLKDGVEPPDWNDTTIPDEKPGQVPKEAITRVQAFSGSDRQPIDPRQISFHDWALIDKAKPQFSPGDGIFEGGGAFGETRLNRETFEFIKRNCLWSKDGLRRYAQAYQDGKKPLIVFPPGAMEVKAAWIDLEREKVPKEKWNTFYSADYKGKKYGLMTLHVITKDIPNWFWASFHHKDQLSFGDKLEPGIETPDEFGQPSALKGTVWENYVLGGTQIEFDSSTGAPTMLSDAHVEKGFVRSSCITCHSTAVISPDDTKSVASQAAAMCILTPTVPEFDLDPKGCREIIGDKYFMKDDKLVAERGAPLPEWYMKNDKLFFIQTDFLYSLPQRAQKEMNSPPKRCVW